MNWKTITAVPIVAAVGIAGGWGLYAWWNRPPTPRELSRQLDAVVFPADFARVPNVMLQTASGPFSRADLAGRWTLLFFGFTNCPDVCPTTLASLSAALDELRETKVPIPRVLFVSVDYRRDTPASVGKYADAFGPAFVGATAEEPVLRRLADSVHVSFNVPDEPKSANYSVQHSSAVFLLDPEGRVRALFGWPQNPDSVAREYRRIRQALG